MSIKSKQCCWQFSPIDTWFFKEARHHDGSGAHLLTSLFPPPVRTLAGAIRTTIGDANQVSWPTFRNASDEKTALLRQQIGPEPKQEYGQLEFSGPWLSLGTERLYPAPAALMEATPQDGTEKRVERITIAEPLHCDLGRVYLPQLSTEQKLRPLGDWLTEAGFSAFLAGKLPPEESMISEAQLLTRESRLGIALENSRRTTQQSMLYQTEQLRFSHEGARHRRPAHGRHSKLRFTHEGPVTVVLEMSYPTQLTLPPNGVVRLGGEGRMAHLKRCSLPALTCISTNKSAPGCRFILVLLTPMEIDANTHSLHLPGFTHRENSDGISHWSGSIAKITLSAYCLVAGKHQQEGGWDIAAKKPRPAISLLPAGSCWYCESEAPLTEIIEQLNGLKISRNTHLGRGQLAVALWPEKEQAISMERNS